jgi:chromosome segregation ATPase
MKKKVKKIAKKNYSADHTGVLLKEMNSKIDLILEDHVDLKGRMTRIDIRMEKVENKLVEHDIKFTNLEIKSDDLKKDVNNSYKSLVEYLSRIEDEIQSMQSELKELKMEMKNKIDISRVNDFEKRLNKLEKLVFAKLGTAGV